MDLIASLRAPAFGRGFLVALLALPVVAQTATSGWSRDYDVPGLGVGGRVFAVGTWQNELIVGTYKQVNVDGFVVPHVARYDGLRWRPLGAGVDEPVRAILDFQGTLVIGGEFGWSGTTNVRGVARWDGAAWQPLGAGLDGIVWDLCEHGGELHACGDFVLPGSSQPVHVARFDGTSWHAVGTATFTGLGFPEAYTLTSAGTLLFVGGEFTAMNGAPASHIAQWDGVSWQGVGGGFDNFGYGQVWDLLVHGGRLFVAGAFGTAGGVVVDDVAVWDGNGWARLGPDLSNQIYGSDARSLCAYNGDVYVGGSFNVLGGTTAVHRIVRYDGTTLQPCGGAVHAEVNPATIFAMVAWGGQLYCGGEFQGIVQPGAPPAPSLGAFHIASFDGATWSRLGTGDWGLEAEAKALGTWQGKRVIGGRATYAGDAYATGLALFDNGAWHRIGTFDGVVWDIEEIQGELWVAGEFRKIDGLTVNGVARWDGAQWHDLAGGPNLFGCNAVAEYQGQVIVGTAGSPMRWNGASWQPITTGLYGTILALHVHNGLLYIGGSTPFTTGSPNLFQYDGTTVSVVGGGTDEYVAALASWNGDLVVGGHFTAAGGQPMQHVARWDGSAFHTIGAGLPGSVVADFAMFQGELVACGDIHAPSGGDYVARFDGTQWRGFAGGAPNGFVSSLLADDARGELHIAGWFHGVGGVPSPNHAVWHARLPWQDVGSGTPSPRRPARLEALSTFVAGEAFRIDVSSAEENTLAVLGFGTGRVDVPVFGALLVPNLDLGTFVGAADGLGRVAFGSPWPVLPSGFSFYAQAFCLDGAMPELFSATNALLLQQP